MKYYTIRPPHSLKDFIRFFWVFENNNDGKPYTYRSMADGCAELLFHYQGTFGELKDGKNIAAGKQPFSLIHSQSSVYKEFTTNESFGIFGVYLYPFVLPLLFSLPSTDFSNRIAGLNTLLGNEGKELEEKIMLADGNMQRINIVSAFLKKKLYKSKQRDIIAHSSIRYVLHSKETTDIPGLASKFNLSVRQFERKFKEYSGFSPKLYSRIIRFGSTLNEYGNNNKSLTEIAYKCGYYDQSHFIHEFKLFSGYHPKEYFVNNRHDAELRIT